MPYSKLVISGNYVEKYEYSYNLPQRRPNVPKGVPRKKRDPSARRRADNINRCRQSFQRLVRTNLVRGAPALLTLTMREVVALSVAWKCFTTFGRKIRARFGRDIAWIVVPEFQKRGAVHYHALVWGLSDETIKTERYTRLLAGIWGWGFVDVIKTDGNAKLSSYLSKYMSKTMSDTRLVDQRAFSASRNILRPMSFRTPTQISFASEEFGVNGDNELVYERSYDTLWLGRCDYKVYKLPESYESSNNTERGYQKQDRNPVHDLPWGFREGKDN